MRGADKFLKTMLLFLVVSCVKKDKNAPFTEICVGGWVFLEVSAYGGAGHTTVIYKLDEEGKPIRCTEERLQ